MRKFLLLLFINNKLIIAAWLKLKQKLQLIFFLIHKTEVMNKGKWFLCALVSENNTFIKINMFFSCFSFLNNFWERYSAFSGYTTNNTVIVVIVQLIISQAKLLKQCGRNKLYHN